MHPLEPRVEAALAAIEQETGRRPHPLRRVPMDMITEAVEAEALATGLSNSPPDAAIRHIVVTIAARNR